MPILEKLYDKSIIYRSVGILLENFNPTSNEQMTLFSNNERRSKNENLAKIINRNNGILRKRLDSASCTMPNMLCFANRKPTIPTCPQVAKDVITDRI